jgi:hypothetical protein
VIRDFQWTDAEFLKAMFAKQGLPVDCLPDLKSHLFVIKKVVEDTKGNPAMAGLVRMTCEPFLLLDHDAENPGWRWQQLQALSDNICEVARTKGLRDCTAWVPPEKEARFGMRLEQLGFIRSPWVSYTRKL